MRLNPTAAADCIPLLRDRFQACTAANLNEKALPPQALESLADFMQGAGSVTVLTGAGVSTGIET